MNSVPSSLDSDVADFDPVADLEEDGVVGGIDNRDVADGDMAAVGQLEGVRSPHPDGDDLVLELGSGAYSFAYDYAQRAAIQSRMRARTVARSSSFSSSW